MSKTASALDIVKDAHKAGKITIGYESTLKALKQGELEYAFASRNASREALEDLEYHSNQANVKYSQLNVDSENLGVACRKQFTVSVVGVRK